MLKDNSSEISYDKFIDMVDKDQVKVTVSPVTIVPKKKKNSKYEDTELYTTKTENRYSALTRDWKGESVETDPPDHFYWWLLQ